MGAPCEARIGLNAVRARQFELLVEQESETKSGRVPLPSGLICQYQPEKGMPKMGWPKSAGSVGVGAPSSVLEATRLVR